MTELLKKYIKEGNISNALLVGQNLFNKNKGNKEVFSLYFSTLYDAAKSNYDAANKFINQMVAVLSIYSENADLTESEVTYIRSCEDKLNDLVNGIRSYNEMKKAENYKIIIKNNYTLLKNVSDLISNLANVTNKNQFDNILKEIYELDNKFDKENFVLRQKNEYDIITNNCQSIVNSKLKYFERVANVEYNKMAVASYEKIFNLFKYAKDATYRENDMLELFKYDASRLTNETLIYYNHVYNYILSKLNDDEKLTMTKYSIIAEKKE
jgi:hypothetical protein